MQQDFVHINDTRISLRQRRLMAVLSGVLLAVIEIVFGYLSIVYFHIDFFLFFQSNPFVLTGSLVLLYFIVPIPLSFYISRHTGVAAEGQKAGNMLGCTGSLLAIFIICTWVAIIGIHRNICPPEGFCTDIWPTVFIFAFIPIVTFLHILSALIGRLGSALGSALGRISKGRGL